MSENQEWVLCQEPEIGDILKWREPLWAAPHKPRGKRDKIGEQQIIAKLTAAEKLLELHVMSVTKLSSGDAPLKVQKGENIRRKETSLQQGFCHKLLS